ncbi:MAG: hypothetical protein Q9219_004827 [cf. Caloplaca sp. 3 TL-2023]
MTGVKEQTSTDYARILSLAGFHALTFDAGYQGESTGSPRGLEDPHQRVEDIKAAVSYLSSLPPPETPQTTTTPEEEEKKNNNKNDINPSKIGVLGICASGGYASFATQTDPRIAALATVSATCTGHLTRAGGVVTHKATDPPPPPPIITATLHAASQWRTAHSAGQNPASPKLFDAASIPDNTQPFFKDAAAYYGTERGHHERSDQRVPLMSYDLLMGYDSFRFQHLIAPRPVLMVAGAEAQTRHFSEGVVGGMVGGNREDGEGKEGGNGELFVVQGKNHFDLYDDLEVVGPKVVEFFGKALG